MTDAPSDAPSEFDPPAGSLRRSVGRGAVATGLSQAALVALQVASVLVLSRLLAPGDFGLVAMCAPVVALLGMLQDFGLVQATVQKKGLSRGEVNFLFWVNAAASSAMALLLVALSPLVARFYEEPRVGPLIAAMALPLLLGGLGAQHAALLNRRMGFGKLAVVSVAGGAATLAVSIAWATVSPSYWALLAGTLAGSVVTTALAWAFSGWRPGLPARVAGGRALLGFGAGITGFNFANFFARNLDNVLIGRVWGGVELGFYDRAYKLLLFPLQQIANPLSRVMIPALSRMAEEPDRYRHAFLRVLNLSLLVTLPGVAFAAAMADVLIPLLLGEQWRASAPIFMALGFAGLVQPLNNPTGWLFISQGRSTDFMVWGLVGAGISVAAIVAGLAWGAFGVAVAYAVGEYLKTPAVWAFVGRKGPVGVAHVLRGSGLIVLAAHLAVLGVHLAHDRLAGAGVPGLVAAAALSYAVVVAVLLLLPAGRGTLRQAWDLASPAAIARRRGPGA